MPRDANTPAEPSTGTSSWIRDPVQVARAVVIARPASGESSQARQPEDARFRLTNRSSALLLLGGVVVSTVCYGLASSRTKGIWILPDELTYGLLARSLATTGHLTFRGVSTLAYPIGYPTLIAPAFLGRGAVAAYGAAKWLNAVMMSLAAVPVFLIARRLLPRHLALGAALLSLLIPSMAYTGVLMTENAFFPLFLLVMLAFVRALEVPTKSRQLVALASIIPAVAVRSEGLLLVPSFLLSIVLLGASTSTRGQGRYLRGFVLELRLVLGHVARSSAHVRGRRCRRGRDRRAPTAILGRYANAFRNYPVFRTLTWAAYQLVDLELYVAVIPFVPAGIAVAALLWRRHGSGTAAPPRRRRRPPRCFSSLRPRGLQGNQGGARYNYPSVPAELHDRYCFYAAPLFFIFFLYWVHRREEFSEPNLDPAPARSLGATAPVALCPCPYERRLRFPGDVALEQRPHRRAKRPLRDGGGRVCLLRCSRAPTQVDRPAADRRCRCHAAHGRRAVGERDLCRLGGGAVEPAHDRSWVDESVPAGTRVAVLWVPHPGWSVRKVIDREQALWRAELFNPSIARFFYVGKQMHYNLPATAARLEHGRLVVPGGGGSAYRYVLVAEPVSLSGLIVARDSRAGLALYRVAPGSR